MKAFGETPCGVCSISCNPPNFFCSPVLLFFLIWFLWFLNVFLKCIGWKTALNFYLLFYCGKRYLSQVHSSQGNDFLRFDLRAPLKPPSPPSRSSPGPKATPPLPSVATVSFASS